MLNHWSISRRAFNAKCIKSFDSKILNLNLRGYARFTARSKLRSVDRVPIPSYLWGYMLTVYDRTFYPMEGEINRDQKLSNEAWPWRRTFTVGYLQKPKVGREMNRNRGWKPPHRNDWNDRHAGAGKGTYVHLTRFLAIDDTDCAVQRETTIWVVQNEGETTCVQETGTYRDFWERWNRAKNQKRDKE